MKLPFPSSDFFDLNRFAGKLTKNKIVTAAPALLTGLGLFGTFFGLTTGLSGLNLSTTDTTLLSSGIQNIISGANTAFATSLWGIGLSLAINVVDKICISSLNKKISQLNSFISEENFFPIFKYEQTFEDLNQNNQTIRELFSGLAEQIGNKMQEGLKEASKEMNANIADAINQLVVSTQSWGDKVASGSEEVLYSLVQEFTQKIGSSAMEQREMIDKASERMNDVVVKLDAIMSNYTQITDESFNRLKENQMELNDIHKENLSEFVNLQKESLETYANKLTEVTENIFEKQKEISDSFNRAANNLFYQMDLFKQNIENANDIIAERLKNFDKSCQYFSEASEHIEQASGTIGSVSETLSGLIGTVTTIHEKIENLSDNLTDVSNEAEDLVNTANSLISNSDRTFNDLSKNLKESVSSLEKQVQETFDNFVKSLNYQTEDRLTVWNDQTQQFSSAMLGIVQTMRTLLNEYEEKKNNK